jgi:hypothetical protein
MFECGATGRSERRKTEAAGLHREPNAIIASGITDRGHPTGWRGRLLLRNVRPHKEC